MTRTAERGFALPVTVFVVALLTLMLATGFARVRADRQMGLGSEQIIEALAVAQSGLQNYLGTRTTRPVNGDSVRVNVPGGYAWVTAHVVRQPADTLDPQIYIVRSTGYVVEPTISSAPLAERTVARFAAWQVGTMETGGALVAANGVRRRVNAGTTTFQGNDHPSCALEPPAAGVRTTHIVTPPGPNGLEVAAGSPAGYVEEGASAGAAIAFATGIDWAATIGVGILPDHSSVQPQDTTWSVQRVQGDLVLQNTWGTGLLIVTGDMQFAGDFGIWYGVVLVGGRISFDAAFSHVGGVVVSGLNEQLGQNPTQTLFGGNSRRLVLEHNSCYKHRALASLTGFAEVANAWIDNWATY